MPNASALVAPATYDPTLPSIGAGSHIFQVLNDEGADWDEGATAATYLDFLKAQEGSTPPTGADAKHMAALEQFVEANTSDDDAPPAEQSAEPAPQA